MRRSILAITLFSSFALMACEDGPTQTYNPAPAGAGNLWNNANTPGATDPGKQGFGGTGSAGATKNEICTGDQKAKRWAVMVREPITPPRGGAGLDLAGGESWQGLTIDDAEKINCQGANAGDIFGNGELSSYWGDNGEAYFTYRVSTRKGTSMLYNPGYLGAVGCTGNEPPTSKCIPMKSRDGLHTYILPINSQLQKDGAPFQLDWDNAALFSKEATELVDAMFASYSAGLPAETDCIGSGHCIKGNFGDVAYLYTPALGQAIWVPAQHAAQPAPSILYRIDQVLAKVMGYSFATPNIKLDQEGPIALAGLLGASTSPCTLKMGLTYGSFKSLCVQTATDPQKNQTELNKLLGGLSHNTERFHFDVQGVDVNFGSATLSPTDILHDNSLPADADVSSSLTVDQSTLGKILNDYDTSGATPVRDLHGAGAVYKEYARLVRKDILAAAGITDGNPNNCLMPAGGDPQLFFNTLPAYCTGFEGLVTASPSTGPADFTNLGTNVGLIESGLKRGLKPGHQKAAFCFDANGNLTTGYTLCGKGDAWGDDGDIFATSYAHVLKIMGKGNVANLPPAVQDVRFFFKEYVTALMRYLQVAAQSPVPDLSTVFVNPYDIFFDSIGAGQFESAEYVDRRFVSPTQAPTDIVITADVKNGIMDGYFFSRELFRGENAIYTAMLADQTKGLGAEDPALQVDNTLLTNVFGSPVLLAGWKDTATKSAYYCATNVDAANCAGQFPPTDAKGAVLVDEGGLPILTPYKGAMGSNATPFALGPTGIKVVQTFPNIQQAQVKVPLQADPYNALSTPLPAMKVLVPWVPKQPGEGFPVALTGTRDKFIETSQLDFSGTTITANIDYDVVIDPATQQPKTDGSIQFLAVETQSFLGDVFLCQDAGTGDLLRARMYTSVSDILAWFSSHPTAYNACGIIIRYSPFGNYADYITTLTNGVRLSITQGGGYGRVVDVTLFVPGQ